MPSSGARVRACKPRPPWPTMAERLVSSGEERPPASSPARRLVASDQRTRERRGGGATYADGRDGRKVAVGEMRAPPESRLAESRALWRLDAEAEAGSWRPGRADPRVIACQPNTTTTTELHAETSHAVPSAAVLEPAVGAVRARRPRGCAAGRRARRRSLRARPQSRARSCARRR